MFRIYDGGASTQVRKKTAEEVKSFKWRHAIVNAEGCREHGDELGYFRAMLTLPLDGVLRERGTPNRFCTMLK